MTKTEKNSPLSLTFSGYGHYKITMTYRRKEITVTTTCMPDVDDYNDDNDQRHNRGYKALRNTVIRGYNAAKQYK